jgi:hypothetical protein
MNSLISILFVLYKKIFSVLLSYFKYINDVQMFALENNLYLQKLYKKKENQLMKTTTKSRKALL